MIHSLLAGALSRAVCALFSWLLAAGLSFAAATVALAHEGHDHGSDKAALEILSKSRATAVSDAYQLVALADKDSLVLYIDRAKGNAPVEVADVTVTIGTDQRKAVPRPGGVFAIQAPELSKPGRHELVVTITEDKTADLLITALDVPEPTATRGKPRIIADTPARLSDGSVFLPKVSQRLISLRTETTSKSTSNPALVLVGRVIPDPNRSGVVQSTISGRIAPTDGRLPRLGEAVRAGQVLAIIKPSYAAIDLTNVQQTAGDLDQQIALAQNRVEQFRPLVRSNTLSPERLRTVEIELDNLRKRREALNSSQRGGESLSSPIDGVIAGMKALPGQVVGPQDILFQIVDPKSLWIEALVFDSTIPDLMPAASATASAAKPLKLSFIGRSRTLQQQSTVLHFEVIDPPASLNVGSPVTVLAQSREAVAGIILPTSAIVTAPTGGAIAWVHAEPERFNPVAVQVRPIDGDRVLVEAGLETDQNVVTAAAELLNQVR
jgi:RND family efflux transporter MFP subunit